MGVGIRRHDRKPPNSYRVVVWNRTLRRRIGGALLMLISLNQSPPAVSTTTGAFTLSGNNLTALQGGAATATITANKTTVLPGEVVVLEITDYGFSYTDERKLTVLWNFDDTGSTYSTGSGYSANKAYNPLTNKYWATQGTKNPSVQIWDDAGNLAATGTVAITVEDPDAVSWTRDYTVTNTATWNAVVPASAGERVRVTIADDATIDIGSTTYTTSGANARTYVTASFDGTNRPILTTSTVQHSGFDPRRNGAGFEFIIYGIHGQGTYSQKTGTGTVWSLITGGAAPSAMSTLMSVAACKMTGGNLIYHGGSDQTYGGGLYGYSDLHCRSWLNYAINRFGEWADVTMTGCDVRADPEAFRFEGGSGDNPPAAYDHCVRLGCVRKVGVEANIIYATGGWSTLVSDWAANPSLRVHPTTHTQTAAIFVRNNVFYNHWQTVAIGQVNPSRGFEVAPRIVALDMNTHIIGHQSRFPITIQGQPFSFQNNFCYIMAGDNGPSELNNILQLAENVVPSVTAGGDALIAFNHFISHRGSTFTDVVEQWSGSPTITKTHNVVYCPNASNSGSFTDYTPLSAGDYFAPVNDFGGDGVSVAHNAASSGYRPRFDRDGNVRGSTTNAGAFGTSPTSVTAISAPVNSVVPGAPAEMSGFADIWKLPSFGTWTGLSNFDWEPYLSQTEWQSNGSPVTASYRIFIDNRSGTYTGTTVRCLVTYTNFSGTEVTANSSTAVLS